MRRIAAGAGAIALLAACFAVTFLMAPWNDERVTDLPLYDDYARLFLEGFLPFRDVPFEYPPLAAPVLAAGGLFSNDAEGYRVAFAALVFACCAGVVLLCGFVAERTGAGRNRAMFAAALMPLACGAMLRTHFDIAPVLLTLGALALICAERPRLGMTVLGLAVAVKLYPVVIVPVVLAWLLARGGRRAAVDGTLAMAAVVAVAYGAALVLSAGGTFDSLQYHAERAVQVESSPAVVLRGLDAMGMGVATPNDGHRSDGLDHPAANAVTGAFAALLLLAIAALARAVWRRPDARSLVLASLAATVAFACFGKVLSPQFLIWVVPLAALAFAWRAFRLTTLCLVALLLTLWEFPAHYRDVVDREAWVLWVVALRDLALVGAVAAVLSECRAPATAVARSPWLGRLRLPRSAPR